MEFVRSRASSSRVKKFQQLGFFEPGTSRVLGSKTMPRSKGEIVVLEAFFDAGFRLPCHQFLVEVLEHFGVQQHQLTPNVLVALAKFVWETTTYGGEPSIKVFAKHYCLH